MLQVTIPCVELFDEDKQEFVYSKEQTLSIEHSLVSLSKWESKWNKPFLSKADKSIEESLDYIRCMTITQNVDSKIYKFITHDVLDHVSKYIEKPMTSTVISKHDSSQNREIITAEIIYYWMIALGIPFECQKWHLNRLLTLINVCNIKNSPPKKMGKHALMSRNAALNAVRRQKYNSKG
jgi:hypothetical protein